MTSTITCYFDFEEIAHLDQASTDRLGQLAGGYAARTKNPADDVCFGKLLLHMKHGRGHNDHELYTWLAAQCAEVGVRKCGKTQISIHLRIGWLDPAEVLGRPGGLYPSARNAQPPRSQPWDISLFGISAGITTYLANLGQPPC